MEELKKFYKLLYRFRFIVISVPLITVIIAYFIVRNLPDQYVAEGQISTGIVDETQSLASLFDKQESKINREFSNLIEIIKLQKIINLTSYQLIIHDLTTDKPFRELSSEIKDLSDIERRNVLNIFKRKYANREQLNQFNEEDKLLNRILDSMGYGENYVGNNLDVDRLEISDYLSVRFTSEDPELSAFIVNTITNEFITYYTALLKENQTKSVKFLEKLTKMKNDTLQKAVLDLKDYKIKNGVLDISEQSRKLFEIASQYEIKIQEAQTNVISLKQTIQNIDNQFDPNVKKYSEAALIEINRKLSNTKEKLYKVSKLQIESQFDPKYNPVIDSLNQVINQQIFEQSSKYIDNPLNSKINLVARKLNLQVEYDLALNSINSLKSTLASLKAKMTSLVPQEAVIQSLERKIEISTKEYLAILERFNAASLEASLDSKLRQIQEAMPGTQLPSKKMLLIILSGIISTIFCLLIFFIIFYLDDSVTSPRELAQITEIPVLGKINRVNSANLALKEIWSNLHSNPEMQELKKQLRSARYEISREMVPTSDSKGQVLNITSMNDSEGKTLLIACIAYSYVVIRKKILLIDGNFDHPNITENSNTTFYLEDYLKTGNLGSSEFSAGIMVMGNKGEDTSLFEITDEKTVRARFETLRSQFDIILVETPSLETLSKAKEWNLIADKVMGVFEANQTISGTKKQHINYLKSLNSQFIGWVINKVSVDPVNTKNEAAISTNFIE
ncbi:MAG: lipopolysaccharide biosynthesis protein [Bacteroidetes bacterium]|nr:lipopolysaccharide biosynthesis protein [Bacteroidota bacterium]MBU1484052.1 lipopolysaccharide biosynthesis protein [Bacteroidota bacterium]MBU2267072.1 lipopolysaccharide biosynthesis protein [Bacteroidota bacterium]MBU2374995.1 lipopolysaccharide biosynthesis protein [Bacteroidota bacterium]